MESKRKRYSTAVEIEKGINAANDQIRTFGASFMDVPEAIFIDILLRLNIKEILVCKCTCKTWRCLILSPQFASLHFARSETGLLIRNLDSSCVPRILYLIDPSEIDIKSCRGSDEQVDVSLDVKLKIPLRNPRMALEMAAVKKKRCVRLRLTDHKSRIVNSCNGFLCLSEPSANEPVAVCNPVTGEYIYIPEGEEAYEHYVDCGFGFCPTTNEYKVIRIFDSGIRELFSCPVTRRVSYSSRMAEVHTLGRGSWKSIGNAPSYYGKLTSPTYLNGNLHWFYQAFDFSNIILSFDFRNERFKTFPPPDFQYDFSYNDISHMSMGVFRGNLCICLPSYYSIGLWVMEKYGVKESWTEVVRIQKRESWEPSYVFHPINFLKCGSLLMFYYPKNVLIHYDPESKERKELKICGTRSKCEAVALIPSFFSLKKAVQGNSSRVLNVSSWCARIKLQGENKALSVREENKEIVTSDSSTYWSDEEWDDGESGSVAEVNQETENLEP